MVQGHKIFNFRGPAQKILVFVAWGQKILVCSGLETENIGFYWSGNRKYWFLVVRGQKILVFGGPGTENIGFWWSGDRQKILVFSGLGTENIGF